MGNPVYMVHKNKNRLSFVGDAMSAESDVSILKDGTCCYAVGTVKGKDGFVYRFAAEQWGRKWAAVGIYEPLPSDVERVVKTAMGIILSRIKGELSLKKAS